MSSRWMTGYGCLLVFAVVSFWLRSLGASLWLDETVSYWVASAGFGEMFARNVEFQFGSPYHWLLWLLARGGGAPSEWLLRLPSLIAVGGAAWFVSRITAALFDRETGLIAAVLFVCTPMVVEAAYQARPYGLALLCVTAGMHFQLRWVRAGLEGTAAKREAVMGLVLTCLAIYVQPVFGVLLIVPAVGVLLVLSRGGVSPGGAAGLALFAVACLALLPVTAGGMLSKRAVLSWAEPPQLAQLLRLLALPVAAFVGLAANAWLVEPSRRGGALSRLLRSGCVPGSQLPVLVLVLLWAVVPPLLLFAISSTSETQLYIARYFVSAAPGLAILVAGGISLLAPPALRFGSTLAFVILAAITFTPHLATYPDWRHSAEIVRGLDVGDDTPVLFHSGLVESAQIEWLDDPARQPYLEAPLAAYPLPGRIVLLPYTLRSPGAAEYLEKVYESELSGSDRFIVAGRFPSFFRTALARRARNFSLQKKGAVLVFERR